MALVVLLRKPPEHGRVVHIRFRATVPVEEKEIAVTVNLYRICFHETFKYKIAKY